MIVCPPARYMTRRSEKSSATSSLWSLNPSSIPMRWNDLVVNESGLISKVQSSAAARRETRFGTDDAEQARTAKCKGAVVNYSSTK